MTEHPRDRDHLEAVKASADGPTIALALGLRGRGRRFFCPACQSGGGKTPDLAVSERGFICHKCGQKGDILALVELAAHLNFKGALEYLERETGIPAPGPRRRRSRSSPRPAAPLPPLRPEKKATEAPSPEVYIAFLQGCRPVEGKALSWLVEERGIAPEVIARLEIRFCGKEYQALMAELGERFTEDQLVAAGLSRRTKEGKAVPSFWHYYAKRAGFLVIPYFLDGVPVYLKARPPVSKADAERLELVRFMNTAAAVPCLYNADALAGGFEKVLICEGESDTWTALSPRAWSSPAKLKTWTAVGSPGARNFKAAWAEAFRGFQKAGRSTVYLVMDADKAGKAGARIIADLFLRAELPAPLELILPTGKDLSEYVLGGDTLE